MNFSRSWNNTDLSYSNQVKVDRALRTKSWYWTVFFSPTQIPRPLAMKKEGIQTRKRKPKNLNKTKPGMCYTVVLNAGGADTPQGSV